MIVRLVKMTFRDESVSDFDVLFEKYHQQIRNFPGCTHLQLLKDGRIYFTYSHWENAQSLENYRNSPLFQEVWPATKKLFSAPAEAWSTEQLYHLE
ncbi:MAG: antibiotic biosynthesis monooxygenase [Sphingobacteriaceae bacterium]|nr:antibiotic biosynthesis monooxygenase [Sphingobacteriaceae bacterium]